MRISLIIAIGDDGVIGRGNALPWRLPADLKRFKALTMGHHLLMGRRTFESIGRILPGRTMVVLSRGQPELPPGAFLAANLAEAIELARQAGDVEAFVAGGAQVYTEALQFADRIYLTRVHGSFPGETRFDLEPGEDWRLVHREDHPADAKNPHAHSFLIYDRRGEDAPG